MSARLLPELEGFLAAREAESERVAPARRAPLERLAGSVRERLAAGGPARLVFVCTHNSRRSHMAALWAAAAAVRAGLERVEVFSAGTEATAVHPNAVAALRRAGFAVERLTGDVNPHYRVRFAAGVAPLEVFSKTLRHPSLPESGFTAVMTCSEADAACPAVPGADARVALPWEDPKAHDGTALEAAAYDERCAEIARELRWAFARVASHG